MENFSEALKKLRLEKNVKQSELAMACGLSTRQIIRYEQGISEPTLSVLVKFANYFEVSIDCVCGRE